MLLLGGLLAFSLCVAAVPAVIALAWRIGAVDVPCDWRRMHRKAIPRAGGIAIFCGFAIAAGAFVAPSPYLTSLLCGGALMLLAGLADDMLCLPAFFKLLFQFAVATASVFAGGIVSDGALWGVLWVVLLTNAHNFIDGLDGLLAGCVSIEGIALCAAFLIRGMQDLALLSMILGAACLGFRCFNRHPARIFAGDCGSGTVGFLLGLISLPLFESGGDLFVGVSPLFLFAYPLTDLFAAVVRRFLRGKNPFAADRAHLHHRICAVGLRHSQCVGVLLSISAALGGVGVLLAAEAYPFFTGVACLASAILLIRLRHFITDCA